MPVGWYQQDYPADFDRVIREMRALAELEVGQVMKGGTDYLGEFGLAPSADDPNGPDAVVFRDASGTDLGRLEIGDERMSSGGYPDGTYVRMGDGPVWLVATSLRRIPRTPREWVKTDIVSVYPTEIAEVQVTPAKGDAYTLSKQGADGYTLDGLAEDEEVDATVGAKATRAIQRLEFTNIADPSLSDAEMGFDEPSVYNAVTTEGLVYEATLGGEADANNRYARFLVKPPVEVPELEAEEGEEEAPDASDTDRLAARAEDENARLTPWTYVIPKRHDGELMVARQELIKKVEPPEPEEPEAEPTESETEAPDSAG